MFANKLPTVKVANLPSILFVKWHNVSVQVFHTIYESICAGTSFFRDFGIQDSTNYQSCMLLPLLLLLLINKPALELSNKSLLTIVNSQDGPQGPTGWMLILYIHVQYEHSGRGWRLDHTMWAHKLWALALHRRWFTRTVWVGMKHL